MASLAKTLGELKHSSYRSRSVKQEMRENLIACLREGRNWMPGILGYEETVLRQFTHALLAGHDVLLLGLRGQGKTRLLRQLVNLLDEEMPIIAGSEVNDDPFAPISKLGRDTVEQFGDATPIEWVGRDRRYGEKLATPDVSMADLIGDIDPIKALNQKLSYSHEGAIQFGIIPRTNRGIFVVNELPDLQPRIQVGLLNILEEGDIQIRAFKVRLQLDLMMAFSANPEDYTNRGNIITPLKDRIESQILTHYPKTPSIARRITGQEAWLQRGGSISPRLSESICEIVERIAFIAREDKDYVDQKSGVSARLPIAALELLDSAVEARGLKTGENNPRARLLDLEAVVPAVTGKLELVYAGEQEGPVNIARALMGRAVKAFFGEIFRDPYNKKEKNPEENPYYPVMQWFESGHQLVLSDTQSDAEFLKALEAVPGLREAAKRCALKGKEPDLTGDETAFWLELILEGLSQHGRLAKENLSEGFRYRDVMSDILGTSAARG